MSQNDWSTWNPYGMKAKAWCEDIFEAAENGNIEDLKYFIGKKGVSVNSKKKAIAKDNVFTFIEHQYETDTPLHLAVDNGANIEAVKYLISQGADVNAKDFERKTPLHRVVASSIKSNTDIIKYLISKCVNVNTEDMYGRTPLDYAKTEDIKSILREAGGVNGR